MVELIYDWLPKTHGFKLEDEEHFLVLSYERKGKKYQKMYGTHITEKQLKSNILNLEKKLAKAESKEPIKLKNIIK